MHLLIHSHLFYRKPCAKPRTAPFPSRQRQKLTSAHQFLTYALFFFAVRNETTTVRAAAFTARILLPVSHHKVVILCCERNATRLRIQPCIARVSRHGRRDTVTIFTAGKGHAGRVFAQISGVLERVSAASQLKVEERWQLLVYYAFRKYQLVHRMYPPLVDGQILLPLA